MVESVAEMLELCFSLRAAGWEEQAQRIIRAADVLEASLHTDAELWMVNDRAFETEWSAGVAILKRAGGGKS